MNEQQQWLKKEVKERQKEEPHQKQQVQKPSAPPPELPQPPIQLQQQTPTTYQPLSFPDLKNVLAEMEAILSTIDTQLDNVYRYFIFFLNFIILFVLLGVLTRDFSTEFSS